MIWQDRGLYICPIKYALCISEKKFKKELKELKINESIEFTKNGLDATTHYFRRQVDNTECCIVCIKESPGIELLQIYGLLVHEAVHIWQTIGDIIGENNTHEFEAYCIQKLSQNLFYSYEKLKNKENKKK